MDVIHKISIDFGRNQIPPYIAVMQKDSARKIEATLYENGAAWDVPAGSAVKSLVLTRAVPRPHIPIRGI